MNWSRLSWICVLGALVMLIWMLAPAASCTFRGMDETPVGWVDEESTEASQADQQQVAEGVSFFDRFFGNIGICYEQHPIGGQEEWKKQVALGFAGGVALFWVLAFVTKPRSTTG